MATETNGAKWDPYSQGPLRAAKRLRRYGATVYARVDLEWAGKALKALEHAPEIQVIAFSQMKKEQKTKTITMRSLEFPRFWEGTEVDLFGDIENGIIAIYHPATEED